MKNNFGSDRETNSDNSTNFHKINFNKKNHFNQNLKMVKADFALLYLKKVIE